jgi:hypothetical protein
MLAFWLGAMIVLPTLPLAVFTWQGHLHETQQLEDQLQNTNRQFAVLASTLLQNVLQEVGYRLHETHVTAVIALGKTADLPYDHIEKVTGDGLLLASSLRPDAVGSTPDERLRWTRVDDKSGGFLKSPTSPISQHWATVACVCGIRFLRPKTLLGLRI